MINAILIDDEMHCIETLSILLDGYCPEIRVVEKCLSAKKGLEAIEKWKPGLVFLDIEMPVTNGFEMLEQCKEMTFSLIFTTSYDHYAIKAIRYCALDYLLKPIDPKELITATHRLQQLNKQVMPEQFQLLLDKVQHKESQFKKIAVPTNDGYELVAADQLVHCEADDNYTHLYLRNKTCITACRTLKEMEELLHDFNNFVRVHHSYIVNLNEVVKYVRGEGGYLVLQDGTTINVSRSRKELLLKRLVPGK